MKIFKDNNSFINNAKVHEYTVDSCTRYGRVYTGSSYQEVFIPNMRTPISTNFTKRLYMAAFNIMFANGQLETINNMVRLLHPIRLRQVIIVIKAFIQKFKIAEKKTY